MSDHAVSSEPVGNAIVVMAADAKFFELAKDSLDSLLRLEIPDVHIGFLDLGLEEADREWLFERRIDVRRPETRLDVSRLAGTADRQMGVLVRPFLRENFPGYDIYVWLDADTWMQNDTAIRTLIQGARDSGAAAVRQNEKAYRFWLWQSMWILKHFVLGYGLIKGLFLASRPHVNCGVFAMRADAPHWAYWVKHYQSAINRTGLAGPHDQFSLNATLYLHRLDKKFLPATANWICDMATPMWDDASRQYCTPYAPYRPISVLHLAGPAKTTTFEIQTTKGERLVRKLRYRRLVPETVAAS